MLKTETIKPSVKTSEAFYYMMMERFKTREQQLRFLQNEHELTTNQDIAFCVKELTHAFIAECQRDEMVIVYKELDKILQNEIKDFESIIPEEIEENITLIEYYTRIFHFINTKDTNFIQSFIASFEEIISKGKYRTQFANQTRRK